VTIERRRKLGRYHSLVVVAEGAHEKDGDAVYATHVGGAVRLGGIGMQVSQALADKCGLETRVTVLGHIQRGGSPSAVDRVLAAAFATHAVELAAKKAWGRVVVKKGATIADEPYAEVRGKSQPIDLAKDPLIKTAEAIGICLGRPLPRWKG
jgi:6-phosphofructokinase 1